MSTTRGICRFARNCIPHYSDILMAFPRRSILIRKMTDLARKDKEQAGSGDSPCPGCPSDTEGGSTQPKVSLLTFCANSVQSPSAFHR
ncbi:unnamed protein product [Nezara viridula]|uniref:Uncharacterized protein n=1 Tax=Nezara viridula TaxID=85310 RepID=A0A9P0H9V9_NEZVI|nr:unnamed protein product [Nezara viridula]